MSFIKTPDGTDIFYKDWGKGQPIVFSHGWPLTADAWDGQMLYFLQLGFRVIAHDRRGHGRSTQTWERNTMDQYADDLAVLMNHLNLQNAIIIGHSTGGGEVTRYLGRHGTRRIAKAVLVGAVPPLMLQTPLNPKGTPLDAFDAIRGATRSNRAQFFKDLPTQFYGWNRKGAIESPGIRDSFWAQGMMGGVKAIYDCIEQFSETDFTEDLKRIDVPTLVVHGDDDQIVPFAASAQLSAKLLPKATLKVYPGADHGLAQTHQERFNADVLAFIRG